MAMRRVPVSGDAHSGVPLEDPAEIPLVPEAEGLGIYILVVNSLILALVQFGIGERLGFAGKRD